MLASRQSTGSSTRRDSWVEVDLFALEHNLAVIKSWIDAPRSNLRADRRSTRPHLMAVVKSDAYGHGALGVIPTLKSAGATWLAVASIDEGCAIRSQEKEMPILILGPVPGAGAGVAIRDNLDLTVASVLQIDQAAQAAVEANKNARIHIKIDSGMHRLGLTPSQLPQALEQIHADSRLELISLFSHLARPDELELTTKQNETFANCLLKAQQIWPGLLQSEGGEALAHLASGEATRRFPFTHYDMVRAGLYLYGLEPTRISEVMKPVMAVRARINQIRQIEAGDGVGYNFTWSATAPSTIASIPLGYADGVNRRLSNRMQGILAGKRVQQVGTISMDQMLFDVSAVHDAQEGDVMTLIGEDGDQSIQLADWAKELGTITYELACGLRMRLPRIYTRDPGK